MTARSRCSTATSLDGPPGRDTDRHGIGCGEQITIRIPDVGASRQHCRLDYDGRQVVLTDLNSANGTWSTAPDPGTPLNPGDVIQIGSARLAFLAVGTTEATQMYTPTGPLPGLYRHWPLVREPPINYLPGGISYRGLAPRLAEHINPGISQVSDVMGSWRRAEGHGQPGGRGATRRGSLCRAGAAGGRAGTDAA